MKNEEIYELLKSLTKEERKVALKSLQELIANEFVLEEYSTNDVIVCPRCGSDHIHPRGSYKNQKRYFCDGCSRNFCSSTNKIGCTTKLEMSIWLKYVECMIDSLSIKASAEKVNVGIKTSFLMRHRILECISKNLKKFTVSNGNSAEIDECYIRESFKGNHKKSTNFTMPREARKHGGEDTTAGISKDQICLMTGINEYNDIFIEISCRGKLKKGIAEMILKDKIEIGSIISTDKDRSYPAVLKELQVSIHNRYDSKNRTTGVINKVNSLHSRFRTFMFRFKGVSTRRLANYLTWFEWIESFKKLDTNEERLNALFIQSINGTYSTMTKEYKNTPYLFMERYS